jgi:glycosyltransferase involved in cell wall biosynthesis
VEAVRPCVAKASEPNRPNFGPATTAHSPRLPLWLIWRMPTQSRKWIITHDFCFDYGGAERVLETVARSLLPDSPVWILGGDTDLLRRMGLENRVRFLIPRSLLSRENYRGRAIACSPLLLRIKTTANLLALSYAFAHFPKTSGQKVVYCHSPLRQIWSAQPAYANASQSIVGHGLRIASPMMRALDKRAARTASTYIATSSVVADRITSYYDWREPLVIPPPIDTTVFRPPPSAPIRDYYLWAGRVVEPYKRVVLLNHVFRQLPSATLLVAGGGRDLEAVRRTAPSNVTFLGPVETDELVALYQNARAVIYPSTDDFGMVPLEGMACGTPAIAFRGGGALDTVAAGTTGVFFNELTIDAIVSAMRELETLDLAPEDLVTHAEQFSDASFLRQMEAVIRPGPRELLP